MKGIFTSYFPAGTDPVVIEEETKQILDIVNNEMAKNDFSGMQVSYANAPLYAEQEQGEKDGGGGLSGGAVAGIVIGVLLLVAVLAVSSVLFIRDRREKEEARRQPRIIPYGGDPKGSKGEFDDDDESDDSDSSSSSSDEDESFVSGAISAPSAADNTTMAQARPQDLEDDASDSSSSSSESEDEDESATDLDIIPMNNEDILKASAASDENPPIYEDYDGRDGYDRGTEQQYPSYSHDVQEQHHYDENEIFQGDYPRGEFDRRSSLEGDYDPHDDKRHYDQTRPRDDGDEASLGSANSADPPGKQQIFV